MTEHVGPVTVTMRVYYSTYHRGAAERFANHAQSLEQRHEGSPRFDIEHRAYVTSSILASVAFLEAAINETLKDAADGHSSYLAAVPSDVQSAWADFWEVADEGRLSTLEKYQEALTMARVKAFEKGARPYQDAHLVIRLRNALVHYKPESLAANSPEPFAQQLSGKFPENRLMAGSGNPFFPDKCLGAGCAAWGLESAMGFADAFYDRLEVKPNYQRVFTNQSDGSA